jgi:hypothetical protein
MNTQGTYNPVCLLPTVKHLVGSVGIIITLHGRITTWECVVRLFPNSDAVFQDDNVPIHIAGIVQSWFEEHEGELQHLPLPTQSPVLNIIE